MLPCQQGLPDQLIMARCGRQDNNHFHFRIRKHLCRVSRTDTIPGRFLFRVFPVFGTAGDNIQCAEPVNHVLKINITDSSASDNACFDRFHTQCSLL